MFVLGKGFAHPIAKEGALKIKEIGYIHAEGYSGGALKHGPFALIEEGDFISSSRGIFMFYQNLSTSGQLTIETFA